VRSPALVLRGRRFSRLLPGVARSALWRWFTSLFASPPPRMITHNVLGQLTYHEGIWDGSIQKKGAALEIALAGAESGPFAAETGRLDRGIEDFAAVQKLVTDSLAEKLAAVPDAKPEDFRITGLWFLWPKRPDYFMVQLALRGDESGLWKLEFESMQATYL